MELKVEDIDAVHELQDEGLVEVENEEYILEDADELGEGVIDGAKDAVAVKKAIDASKPAQAAQPKTKAGMVNSMYQHMSKMNKVDLQAAYDGMMGKKDVETDDDDDDDEDDVEETKKTKGRVKESYDFKSDLAALVSSDDSLTEEFQLKASTIFEAAVKTKVSQEIDRLEEEYTESLQEETATIKSDLVEKIDGYLNYVVENWMEENQVAIESSLRTEISESFMDSLKGVFIEHYIDVPESKIDLVDDLAGQVEELEEQLNKSTSDNIRLNESITALMRSEIIAEASKDLVSTEVEKLKGLVEDIDFEDSKTFAKKVLTIKESYFAKSIVESTEEINEFTGEEMGISPLMNQYISAVAKTLK